VCRMAAAHEGNMTYDLVCSPRHAIRNLFPMNPNRVLLLFALLLCLHRPSFAEDSDLEIRRAVDAMMDDYTNLFMTGRADTIAERIYFAPFVTIPTEGPSAWTTKEQIKENLEKIFQRLAADGYARSQWDKRTITVLSPAAAIVSGTYTRYRKDGSKIGTLAATYTVAKGIDGWRIVTLSRHAPEVTLSGN
jgi:hypothetical protein